jgi:hypothetical protein
VRLGKPSSTKWTTTMIDNLDYRNGFDEGVARHAFGLLEWARMWEVHDAEALETFYKLLIARLELTARNVQ